jgi:hypothetical protein
MMTSSSLRHENAVKRPAWLMLSVKKVKVWGAKVRVGSH